MATAYPSQNDSDSGSDKGDPDSTFDSTIPDPSRRSDRIDPDSSLAISGPDRRSDNIEPDSSLAIAGPLQTDMAHGSDDGPIDPGAKVVSPTQEVFAKPHTVKNVQKMKYKKTLKTTHKHWTCWRSTDNSKIFLGGDNEPYITVLHDNGQEYVYKIRDGGEVWSGVSITDEKQLICITGVQVVTVNITPATPVGSELHWVNTLDVEDPICIFAITKLKYGILCTDPSRIEFCTLRDILMDNELSHFESIKIDIPKSSLYDTACATPDGTICVSSWYTHVIYVFNHDGTRLAILGEKGGYAAGLFGFVRPGRLYWPVTIQRCGDMLLITCEWGDVHTYQDGVWRILTRKGETGRFNAFVQGRQVRFSVCDETTFWAIDNNDQRKVHVYGISNP